MYLHLIRVTVIMRKFNPNNDPDYVKGPSKIFICMGNGIFGMRKKKGQKWSVDRRDVGPQIPHIMFVGQLVPHLHAYKAHATHH